MANYHHLLSTLALVITTFTILTLSTNSYLVQAFSGGFSVELIHRDSPNSPLYNSLETQSERLANAFRRSIRRISHFQDPWDQNATKPVVVSNGEYLAVISIGTPAFPIVAFVDTGSDLIWTNCKPCTECYRQTGPLFDPAKSKTYNRVGCDEYPCGVINETSCGYFEPFCAYAGIYGGSLSIGDIAKEIVTPGSTAGRPVSLPKTIIGCGHETVGTFYEKVSGIIGLGRGTGSLVSQLGSSIAGKFSYCLVPLFSKTQNSSKINFGTNAVVSGKGTVSTWLVKGRTEAFYCLTLEGISVGKKRLDFKPNSPVSTRDGNIVIDVSTTLTLLPEDFYSHLESVVSKEITLLPIPDPTRFLSLCYKTVSDSFKAPTLTVHFRGADVKLSTSNAFVRVSKQVVCFAFKASRGASIYGNLAQTNFLVGYDVTENKVSFKPTDCTN